MVKDIAMHLKFKRTGISPLPLGPNWFTCFLKLHPPLALKISTHLQRLRPYAKEPDILQDYFEKLGWLIKQYGLQESQIYNINKKGFMMGLAGWAKVLCRGGRQNPRVTHYGKRELLTVFETVATAGSVLSPFIINKVPGHYMRWYKGLTEGMNLQV